MLHVVGHGFLVEQYPLSIGSIVIVMTITAALLRVDTICDKACRSILMGKFDNASTLYISSMLLQLDVFSQITKLIYLVIYTL